MTDFARLIAPFDADTFRAQYFGKRPLHVRREASGLPAKMLVAVSPQVVYGFAARSRHEEPDTLAFRVRRDTLSVKVHQRVNVRVLELIDEHSGSAIELEGSRVPVTHSHDVIRALDR